MARSTLAAPRFVPPMAARLVDALPTGDEWSYEVKFDGYRALILKDGDRIRLRSRNDRDLTATYPDVVAAATALRARQAVVDGEVVAVDATGRPSFQALQHPTAHRDHAIAFYTFDLLHLDGRDLTSAPLDERRRRLMAALDGTRLLRSVELPGTVPQIVEAVRGLGLEGVVAKRRTSPYVPGERSDDWRKLKLDRQQEFVLGGYRPGAGGVDALLVGYYERRRLRFAAKVRAGLTPSLRREALARLRPLHAAACPFADLPSSRPSHWGGGVTAAQMAEMQWVAPTLVAQIRFVEWTLDGHLRHAAFMGWRPDVRPQHVRREGPDV